MRSLKKILFLLILASSAVAQNQPVRGTITYIAGDVVYISIGNNSGITDSAMVCVTSKLDTVATLKIFATSSKSSAAHIVTTKQPLSIGDVIVGSVPIQRSAAAENSKPGPRMDSLSTQPTVQAPDTKGFRSQTKPAVSLQGRVSLQYFTTRNINSVLNTTQPGMVLNLRGQINNSPLRFELYGNFRSIALGDQSPFSANSLNQTRIYRMSLDYDDSIYRMSIGRVIPTNAPSIGYIDGLILSRTFGNFMLSAAGGWEPNISQQSTLARMKKIALFGTFHSADFINTAATIAYARSYFYSQLDREMVSTWISLAPSSTLYFSMNNDIDLRKKSNQALILKPTLSSLTANVNYRAASYVSVGAGLSAWRPIYSFTAIKYIPDSVLDNQLRTTPNFSFNLRLSGGVSIDNMYMPRSSEQGFGKEYSDFASIGVSNLFGEGISARGSVQFNEAALSTTRGYGSTFQKSFSGLGDISLRYQYLRFSTTPSNDTNTNQSIGIDVMITVIKNIVFWQSIERQTGLGNNSYTLLSELSWRF